MKVKPCVADVCMAGVEIHTDSETPSSSLLGHRIDRVRNVAPQSLNARLKMNGN